MISRLLKRQLKAVTPVEPAAPHGVAVWAIGDIHGRLDLLKPLVEAVIADAETCDADRKMVIFLGDYVDRGPDSRGVINYLVDLPSGRGIEWHFLRGNHEETMLNFLDDPSVGAQWCEYGGDSTLLSFNLRLPQIKHKLEAWAHLSADLMHRLTPRELEFLDSLELSLTVGDYFFAHAGARPGEALERQTVEDLLWIRRSFLDSTVPFERVVVHGHTPTLEVHADARRVGIDTKAYESGVLTALKLRGKERWLLQTGLAGPSSTPFEPAGRRLAAEEVVVRTTKLSAGNSEASDSLV